MSYRIKMAAEVAGWLAKLREADPDTAGLDAWSAEAIRLSRIRYERDQGRA